jgi:hypothetical protein
MNTTGGDPLGSGRTERVKTISYRDVGYFPDCDRVMRGQSEAEVMRVAC